MTRSTSRLPAAGLVLWLSCFLLCRSAPASDPVNDWPMWGGSPDRNMASSMKGLPASWDPKTRRNVKWVANLGTTSYGNPVVAGGKVFVGTNNAAPRNPAIQGDKGILMAFRESDGRFLWQAVSDKLPSGRANDWPLQGVCSTPLVENDRLYYTTNRGEIVALDTEGFLDNENDGPVHDEKLRGKSDADVVWRYDMMKELGVYQHNMANSSPVAHGDLLFVSTSNGQDENHKRVPSPRAPSLIALSKKTGKLVWQDNSVQGRILHGQWSTPAVGTIGGVVQVVSAQGDGWVRGYVALSGKKLWEFDTNPQDSVWPKTRNELISTPIIWQNIVFIANGQDPEHGDGPGHLYAIDATKRGDITRSGMIWHYDKIRRSVSTGGVYNGLLFYSDFAGFLHCLDTRTGKAHWTYDMLAAVWGSPIVIDGRVYLGDEDGDVTVLPATAAAKGKPLFEINFGEPVYTTPVPASRTLYIVTNSKLWAIGSARALAR